jgi:hypothetical protein
MRVAGGRRRLKGDADSPNFFGLMLHGRDGNGVSGITGQRSANTLAGAARASATSRASSKSRYLSINTLYLIVIINIHVRASKRTKS